MRNIPTDFVTDWSGRTVGRENSIAGSPVTSFPVCAGREVHTRRAVRQNSVAGASELGDLWVAPGNRLIDLKRSRVIGEGVPRRRLLNLPRACCAGTALKMRRSPSDLMRPEFALHGRP